MKKTVVGILICAIALFLVFAGCVPNSREDETISRVYRTPEFLPELTLSGDVEENVVINVQNDCSPVEEGGKIYSFEDIVKKASPKGEVKNYMIFTRSSKGVSINAESAKDYYFTLSGKGVLSLDCDVEVHRMVGGFPLKSVSEIVLCAENATDAGISRVREEGESNYAFKEFIVSHGLYVRIKDATYEGEPPETLTLYSKRVVSASCLTEGNSNCVATLQNGTNVLITEESRYNLHWANGGLFLVEFVSPIKRVDYREDALKTPNLIIEE